MQLHELGIGTMPCPTCLSDRLAYMGEQGPGQDLYKCQVCGEIVVHDEEEGVCGVEPALAAAPRESRLRLICDFDWLPNPDDVLLPF